jgi:hypothetical protein
MSEIDNILSEVLSGDNQNTEKKASVDTIDSPINPGIEIDDGKYIRVGDIVWIKTMFGENQEYSVTKIAGPQILMSGANDERSATTSEIRRMISRGEFTSPEFDLLVNQGNIEKKEKIFKVGTILHTITRGENNEPGFGKFLIRGYDRIYDAVKLQPIFPSFSTNNIEMKGSDVYYKLATKTAEIRYQALEFNNRTITDGASDIPIDQKNAHFVTLLQSLEGEPEILINNKENVEKSASINTENIIEKIASGNNGIPHGTVARTIGGYPLIMMFSERPKSAPSVAGLVYYLEFQPSLIKQAKEWLDRIYANDTDARWGSTSDPNIKFVSKLGFDRMLQRGEVAILYRINKNKGEKTAALQSYIVSGPGIQKWSWDRGSAWKVEGEFIVRDTGNL